ncbi:MAG TPA: endo alpha-1,4 polygalactosaminidase [Actinotalea sp.]|nr:endo alpha-1,4 polygalactosaminidase [Actinotalea sp.]
MRRRPGSPATSGDLRLPPAGARFDYQLGGAYEPPEGVRVVVRDRTDPAPEQRYEVCYLNGFQTQPGESGWWWTQHRELVLAADGAPVIDAGWPDEYLLDTSSEERRAEIADVLAPAIARCADTGFQAVELDNLDSLTRWDGRLTQDDALELASRLIAIAHARGLAVAQKNAAEIGAEGRAAGFDFAVAEECHRWDECSAYADVYGEHVLDIEYADDLRGTWAEVCADPQTPASVVLGDRELAPAGAPG